MEPITESPEARQARACRRIAVAVLVLFPSRERLYRQVLCVSNGRVVSFHPLTEEEPMTEWHPVTVEMDENGKILKVKN